MIQESVLGRVFFVIVFIFVVQSLSLMPQNLSAAFPHMTGIDLSKKQCGAIEALRVLPYPFCTKKLEVISSNTTITSACRLPMQRFVEPSLPVSVVENRLRIITNASFQSTQKSRLCIPQTVSQNSTIFLVQHVKSIDPSKSSYLPKVCSLVSQDLFVLNTADCFRLKTSSEAVAASLKGLDPLSPRFAFTPRSLKQLSFNAKHLTEWVSVPFLDDHPVARPLFLELPLSAHLKVEDDRVFEEILCQDQAFSCHFNPFLFTKGSTDLESGELLWEEDQGKGVYYFRLNISSAFLPLPRHYIFVLDGSAHTDKEAFEGFKRGVVKSIAYLNPLDTAQVIMLDQNAHICPRFAANVDDDCSENIADWTRAIEALTYYGYFVKYNGVDILRSLVPHCDDKKENHVIFLTNRHLGELLPYLEAEKDCPFFLSIFQSKPEKKQDEFFEQVASHFGGVYGRSNTHAAFPRLFKKRFYELTKTFAEQLDCKIIGLNHDLSIYPKIFFDHSKKGAHYSLYGVSKNREDFRLILQGEVLANGTKTCFLWNEECAFDPLNRLSRGVKKGYLKKVKDGMFR